MFKCDIHLIECNVGSLYSIEWRARENGDHFKSQNGRAEKYSIVWFFEQLTLRRRHRNPEGPRWCYKEGVGRKKTMKKKKKIVESTFHSHQGVCRCRYNFFHVLPAGPLSTQLRYSNRQREESNDTIVFSPLFYLKQIGEREKERDQSFWPFFYDVIAHDKSHRYHGNFITPVYLADWAWLKRPAEENG